MAGILASVKVLSEIIKVVSNNKNGSAGQYIADILKKDKDLGLLKTDGSITKLLTNFTIEPIIICSKDAKNSPIFDKMLLTNVDIFASFYIQAFEILKQVYNIDLKTSIDLLSTDQSNFQALARNALINVLSKENFNLGLEEYSPNFLDMLDRGKIRLSTERSDINSDELIDDTLSNTHVQASGYGKGKDGGDTDVLHGVIQRSLKITTRFSTYYNEDGNRTREKNDSKGGRELKYYTVEIPLLIKANVIITDLNNIIGMLAPNSRNKKFLWRLDEYRAGAIKLKDLLFASDLIREYKQNKLKDQADLTGMINRRVESANSRLVSSDAVGFEKNYSMLIISSRDKVKFDSYIGGDISLERNKQDFLTQAHAMTYSLLDDDYERVTIHTKDIRGVSNIGYKALMKRKDSSDNFEEIVKALLMNKTPTF